MLTLQSFNNTIDYWIRELEAYDHNRLVRKSSPGSWSIGQLYYHLIRDTKYFITQINTCLENNLHAEEESTTEAKLIFQNNALPDVNIKGADDHFFLPEVDDVGFLRNELFRIRLQMNSLHKMILESNSGGKTKHPGLGYFTAREWFKFADIHFRHHLKQKQRIDTFCNYGE